MKAALPIALLLIGVIFVAWSYFHTPQADVTEKEAEEYAQAAKIFHGVIHERGHAIEAGRQEELVLHNEELKRSKARFEELRKELDDREAGSKTWGTILFVLGLCCFGIGIGAGVIVREAT